MSGQFPNRIPPSGVFDENVNGAGLGSAAFMRVGTVSEDVTLADVVITKDLTFTSAIPLAPGGQATVEVDLDLWWGRNPVGTAGDDPQLSIAVQLMNGATLLGGPITRNFMVAESGFGTSRDFRNHCLLVVDNAEQATGMRVTYTSSDFVTATALFPAGQSEYVVSRVG